MAASTGLWFAALFGGAGDLSWERGWIYVAANLAMMTIAGMVVHRANPDLFEARAHWRHSDTKRFDKFFLAIFLPLYYVQPLVAGLDNNRFQWWPIPFAAIYPGLLLFVLAIGLLAWAMAVNPFAETTVRIQTERAHTVITSGPYALIRHPMYVAAILMVTGTALILGSMWALLLSALVAVLFIARTALEDRTLRRELPGYDEYARRTRYRLLPGLW